VTVRPQATFVVEYPCDRFCRIEIELGGVSGDVTLQQLWEKGDGQHRRIHEPDLDEPEVQLADEGSRRPAATLFSSPPGSGGVRRR
jgi:hypothetical protein